MEGECTTPHYIGAERLSNLPLYTNTVSNLWAWTACSCEQWDGQDCDFRRYQSNICKRKLYLTKIEIKKNIKAKKSEQIIP